MNGLRWLAVGLLLTHVSLAYSDGKSHQPSGREIKALVNQLVSPNPKPKADKSPFLRLPPGFKRKNQSLVREAQLKLTKLGPVAFPYLFERWDDSSYCLTASNGLSGAFHNLTVGDICQEIIFDQLQPYSTFSAGKGDPRSRKHRPGYPETFLGSKKAAGEWWKKQKCKTLHQMQIEVLDWVIAEEAKHSRDYTDQERQELKEMHKKLVDSGKPMQAGNYSIWSYSLIGAGR